MDLPSKNMRVTLVAYLSFEDGHIDNSHISAFGTADRPLPLKQANLRLSRSETSA
ncbi:MAG: hypothetical protein MUE44_34425 [Oscillatoriaceae cyanobacterium Prado104]|nr:hypothetical protein [Oscillatoriaceae cyanobacterium Prado104]